MTIYLTSRPFSLATAAVVRLPEPAQQTQRLRASARGNRSTNERAAKEQPRGSVGGGGGVQTLLYVLSVRQINQTCYSPLSRVDRKLSPRVNLGAAARSFDARCCHSNDTNSQRHHQSEVGTCRCLSSLGSSVDVVRAAAAASSPRYNHAKR